jgi:hypothetical protein
MLRGIGPAVHAHGSVLPYVGIGAGHYRCVEHRMPGAAHELEILGYDIAHIGPAPQGHVNHIGDETVLMNAFCQLEGVIANGIIGEEFLHMLSRQGIIHHYRLWMAKAQ